MKVLLSPKVEEPNIILFGCAGTLCAERATAPQSSSRKAPWSCALLKLAFVELSGSGPGFCCSTSAAYSTWNATHSDGGEWECRTQARSNCLPGLLCSWRLQTFIPTRSFEIKFHSWSKRLLGTAFKSLQEFKVCAISRMLGTQTWVSHVSCRWSISCPHCLNFNCWTILPQHTAL